jgi:plastocyanin
MRRIALAVFAAALTFVALAAPSAAGGGHCINDSRPTEGTSPDVRIAKCQFMSALLRVPVGTTVRWTNDDVLPHVVSGTGWGSAQSVLMNGDSFAHEFTEAGIFPYTCTLHPGMSAVVFVGDTAASKPDSDPWLATALVASLLVGVTGFAAGRYLGR